MTTPAQKRRRLKWLLLGAVSLLLVAGLLLNAGRALAWYYNPARSNPDKAVVLLTTKWCPYCSILRHSLQQSHIPFREIDVESSRAGQWAFRASGARGIPVTLIGQQYVSGGLGPQLKALTDAGYPVYIAIPDEVRQRLQQH